MKCGNREELVGRFRSVDGGHDQKSGYDLDYKDVMAWSIDGRY